MGFRPMHRLPSPFVVLVMVAADVDPVAIAAFEVGRLVLRAVVHSAIDYPPGVELTLALEAPLEIAEAAPRVLPPTADPALSAVVGSLPFRTQSGKHHRDSDLTNLLFVGSQAQVERAFAEAGWTEARPMCMRARLRGLWALVAKRPYKPAAVSRQELEGRPPDLVFEKQNNTLAKRHHVRIWQYQEGPAGETVWVGAATHDVAIVFDHKDHAFTHRIDPRIDGEREKIVNDLQFTGEVAAVSLVDRPVAPPLDGDGARDRDRRARGRHRAAPVRDRLGCRPPSGPPRRPRRPATPTVASSRSMLESVWLDAGAGPSRARPQRAHLQPRRNR